MALHVKDVDAEVHVGPGAEAAAPEPAARARDVLAQVGDAALRARIAPLVLEILREELARVRRQWGGW
jgi:hypothetical protein